jgi:uncharacterized membrane protein
MKRSYAPAAEFGIGAMAGLRTMTPPAVIALATRRGWIHLGMSPFARLISARSSKTIIELAISELIADKLPFTPSRLRFQPLVSRVLSGAICGATVSSVLKRPLVAGAVLGALGAIAGAVAGHHVRTNSRHDTSPFSTALLEDALAITGSVTITALIGTAK